MEWAQLGSGEDRYHVRQRRRRHGGYSVHLPLERIPLAADCNFRAYKTGDPSWLEDPLRRRCPGVTNWGVVMAGALISHPAPGSPAGLHEYFMAVGLADEK